MAFVSGFGLLAILLSWASGLFTDETSLLLGFIWVCLNVSLLGSSVWELLADSRERLAREVEFLEQQKREHSRRG